MGNTKQTQVVFEYFSVSYYFGRNVFCKPTGLLLYTVFSNIELLLFFLNFCEYVSLCAYEFLMYFLTFLFFLLASSFYFILACLSFCLLVCFKINLKKEGVELEGETDEENLRG